MDTKTLQELTLYFNASGIPLTCFLNGTITKKYGHNLQDYNLPLLLSASLPADLPEIWYTYTPESIYFCGILLPASSSVSREMILLGPVLLSACAQRQAEDICRRLGQPLKEWSTLQRYFNRTGACDFLRLMGNLRLLCHQLHINCPKEIPHVPFQWKIPYQITNPLTPVELPTESEMEEEKTVLDCIRTGNLTEANRMLSEHILPLNIANPLYQKRAYNLGFNMIAFHTAYHAGVDYDLLYNTRNEYIDRIMLAKTDGELAYLFSQCFREYTSYVAAVNALISDAPIVKKIHQYIQKHFDQKITPSTLAETLHMDVYYLCHSFKKETGITIGDYVQQQKIEEAKRLLKGSRLSIAEISEALAFSSQSYFSAIFKKITGMTPASYRKSENL